MNERRDRVCLYDCIVYWAKTTFESENCDVQWFLCALVLKFSLYDVFVCVPLWLLVDYFVSLLLRSTEAILGSTFAAGLFLLHYYNCPISDCLLQWHLNVSISFNDNNCRWRRLNVDLSNHRQSHISYDYEWAMTIIRERVWFNRNMLINEKFAI